MSADEVQRKVAQLLVSARHALALTGAGVSTPSGIPDFRSPNGLWARYDINEYATITAFRRNPLKVWNLFRELGATIGQSAPNSAHKVLARFEQMGLLKGVITQNIDGLHQAAGSRIVHEFHGSCATYSCPSCRDRMSREDATARFNEQGIPVCTCLAIMRPDIVLFGESIPMHALHESLAAARKADLIIVAGTSAQVAPASELPTLVKGHGGTVVEMNMGRTELSDFADYRIVGDLSTTLPALLSHVESVLSASHP